MLNVVYNALLAFILRDKQNICGILIIELVSAVAPLSLPWGEIRRYKSLE